MKEQIQAIPQAMCEGNGPIEDIRAAANMIVSIAIGNYTGYLLKSAFNMAAVISQFANDLEGTDKA